MYLLHNIGPRFNSNYNQISEILESEGPISFDGIYSSVETYSDRLAGKDITLFVMGKFIGSDNSFDVGQIPEKYLTWPQILWLEAKIGAKIGYHSWSHRDLTTLSDAEILLEITPPFPMERFAYPHGRVDGRVAKLVEKAGYTEAWAAGPHGDGSQFQRKRRYLGW